jgi:hypothetical protein
MGQGISIQEVCYDASITPHCEQTDQQGGISSRADMRCDDIARSDGVRGKQFP